MPWMRGDASSSSGTGLGLSGRSPGSRIWGAGAAPWCFGVDSLMSDAVVVGRLLPLPSCGGRIEEQKSEFLLAVHLPGSSQLCRHRSVWSWRWPAGSEVPGRRRVDNQHSRSRRFRKEWGEKPAPGLVFPRADISISQTPLAAPSRLSSTSLGWVPEHPGSVAPWQAEPSWESARSDNSNCH